MSEQWKTQIQATISDHRLKWIPDDSTNPIITSRKIEHEPVPVQDFYRKTLDYESRLDEFGDGVLEQTMVMKTDVAMRVFEEIPDVHIVELQYRLEVPVIRNEYNIKTTKIQ